MKKTFYDKFNVPCEFVGHTLADQLPLLRDKSGAREQLKLEQDEKVLAILPGSRKAEVEMLGPIFLQAAEIIYKKHPEYRFIVPMVNDRRREQFQSQIDTLVSPLPITLYDGQSSAVLQAADTVMLASGTAALEAMLAKAPMVVAYKVKALTYMIAKSLSNIEFTSLPNLIAGKEVVKELNQDNCTVDKIVAELERLIEHDGQKMIDTFTELHQLIRCDADSKAAEEVIKLLNRDN